MIKLLLLGIVTASSEQGQAYDLAKTGFGDDPFNKYGAIVNKDFENEIETVQKLALLYVFD